MWSESRPGCLSFPGSRMNQVPVSTTAEEDNNENKLTNEQGRHTLWPLRSQGCTKTYSYTPMPSAYSQCTHKFSIPSVSEHFAQSCIFLFLFPRNYVWKQIIVNRHQARHRSRTKLWDNSTRPNWMSPGSYLQLCSESLYPYVLTPNSPTTVLSCLLPGVPFQCWKKQIHFWMRLGGLLYTRGSH